MSTAKWFAVRNPSTGENNCHISQSRLSRRNSADLQKCCTIFTRPPFPLAVLKGGLGTRLLSMLSLTTLVRHSGRVGGKSASIKLGNFTPPHSFVRTIWVV